MSPPTPSVPRVSSRRALAVVLVVAFVGLRPHLFSTGFHLDDWYEASLSASGPGYWDGVRGFARSGIYWDRPGNMLLLPLVHRLSGTAPDRPIPTRPWVPQVLSGLLEAAEGWLLFLLVERLLGRADVALAAAALALLFPNRGGFHYRPSLVGQHAAQALMLASMLAHLGWRDTRRRAALAASQGLYAAGLLIFETPIFTPLLLAGAEAGRAWSEGQRPGACFRTAARCLAPYGATIALVLFWKAEGLKLIAGALNQKSSKLFFSPLNVVKVAAAGLGCTTLWPLSLSAVRLADAARELGWLWLPLGAFAAWAWAELSRPWTADALDRRGGWILGGAAAGGFVGTYLPFAASAHHMPYVNGVLSRVNAAGAWVAGLWLAGLLAWLPRRARAAALAVALVGFGWTNWVESRSWSAAWTIEEDVISSLGPQLRGLPGPVTLLLTGAPINVHGAHVFDSDYDLGNALRMLLRRDDVLANVLAPNMEVRGEELVQSYAGVVANRYPLSSLLVYDHRDRRLKKAAALVPPPPESRTVGFKLVFGPGMQP